MVARSIRVAMVVMGASTHRLRRALPPGHPQDEDGHVVTRQPGLEVEGGVLDAVGDGLGVEAPTSGHEVTQALGPEDPVCARRLGDAVRAEHDHVARPELDGCRRPG